MKKRFAFIALAALAIGGIVFFSSQKKASDQKEGLATKTPLVAHAESVAQKQSASFEFSYPGTIASEGETNLVAQVSGTVVAENVALNQFVTTGKTLFTIDETGSSLTPENSLHSSDLQAASLTLKNAKKAYQEALHQDNQKKSATSENAKIEARNNRDIAELAYTALLDKRFVKSPIAGIVTVKNVAVGDSITSGTSLATISRGKKIIRFFVSDAERLLLSVGQEISFTKDTHKTTLLSGKILRVSHTADGGSRRFLVEAESTDSGFKDFSTSSIVTVFVSVTQKAKTGNFFLPLSAILREQNGSAVFVFDNGTVRRVPINIQSIDGEIVELSGITEPETLVITSNVKRLKDGDALILE